MISTSYNKYDSNNQSQLYISIESSCDETSIALMEKKSSSDTRSFFGSVNSNSIIGSIVSSQIKIHQNYGGVIPEIGARNHASQIHWIFENMINSVEIDQKNMTFLEKMNRIAPQISHIFVTVEPGLASALRVGVEFAKSLAYYIERTYSSKVPINYVNHLRGHIVSAFFDKGEVERDFDDASIFPHLHLLVSGGNTQLLLLNSWNNWHIVGKTLDDAVGESFDKIGRMVGLPYPGGVYCSKIAGCNEGNPLNLPVSMVGKKSLDFSYSGLKTSIRYLIQKSDIIEFEKKLPQEDIDYLCSKHTPRNPTEQYILDICISTQTVIIKQLINKIKQGITQFSPRSLGLSGGVSANPYLREKLGEVADLIDAPLFIPDISLTGDNAVMIGLAGILDAEYTD